ncbi:MAG TPA: bifunctional acetate--CoA ligase family protein/GNAT family N-acetyltransferase [Thermoanaerobaculaceae bacterium]|nr:bifunctional acetate--CoA ligase family protein/GNAT family N-acetyltransferase [Thermoanaerobaculaceae bacterium]
MDIHRLDSIFKPQRIALVGVTENPKSVSGTVLRNLVGSGFRGVVYPVNPVCEAVAGVPCYPSVHELPRTPDLAVVCSPAHEVPDVVRACGEAGIPGLVVVSAGFRETGPAGAALEERIAAEARRFEGMRIVGPNCLGVIVPALDLNATFALGMPKAGKVAFVSQSGALCTSVLDWALEQGIGFSYFVSIGNMVDVEFGDLIDYFGEDEQTESVILYVESLRDARRFMTAARAFARTKPIVAYKAGRFPESARAAASHTGALASEDAIYEAAFERAGIARVFEIGDVFNCAELVGRHRGPAGPRLAIVTNAGGPGVMATDALIARDGVLAELAPATLAALDEALPPAWSHGNPVDVLGDATSKRYSRAVATALADPGVDAVLAILTPQAMTNPTATAREVGALAATTSKPILAAWLGGRSVRDGLQALTRAGVASYETPEEAVKAFMTLVAYERNLEILYETPRDVPVTFTLDRTELRARFEALIPPDGDTLSEVASKTLLDAYGIPVARGEEATTPDEAVAIADRIGYPVVAKLLSPDVTHKSDVGGVALGLPDGAAVRAAFGRIVAGARERRPGARVDGVTVQPMVSTENGVEVIVGAKTDPVFGAVLLAGLGGVSAEVFGDRALGLPPLNERLARRMLESLKAWPLLRGFRGRPAVAVDRLIEILMRLSYLVADCPEIRELDVNPLLVTPRGVVALDARIIVDRGAVGRPPKPYAHLALRPYPEEYVRPAALPDGARLVLRPIRPEDEPAWKAMLASCSRETIYARFRYMFQWSTHQAAIRYCFVDYDREIAIVAEYADGDQRRLVGVGRLVADPDLESVEYAVLVTDAWQNRGLGALLTDYCIEIAAGWGAKRVVAQTTSDNRRMLALFERRGFAIEPGEDGLVNVSKPLGVEEPAALVES